MSVELVATQKSDSMLLETLPALVGPGAGSSEAKDPIPGGYHCLVSLVEGQLVVWDLGSAGGTFVNGASREQGGGQTRRSAQTRRGRVPGQLQAAFATLSLRRKNLSS